MISKEVVSVWVKKDAAIWRLMILNKRNSRSYGLLEEDPQMISTCCGKWLVQELWTFLSEDERMEARKAALRRFWSHA